MNNSTKSHAFIFLISAFFLQSRESILSPLSIKKTLQLKILRQSIWSASQERVVMLHNDALSGIQAGTSYIICGPSAK